MNDLEKKKKEEEEEDEDEDEEAGDEGKEKRGEGKSLLRGFIVQRILFQFLAAPLSRFLGSWKAFPRQPQPPSLSAERVER